MTNLHQFDTKPLLLSRGTSLSGAKRPSASSVPLLADHVQTILSHLTWVMQPSHQLLLSLNVTEHLYNAKKQLNSAFQLLRVRLLLARRSL